MEPNPVVLRLLGDMETTELVKGAVTLHHLEWESFEGFYRAHWHDLYRTLAAVLRDSELAEEAANEAMVRAFQRWGTVKRYDNPEGWVYRVGLNWARSWLRKTRRETRGVGDRPVNDHLSGVEFALEQHLAALSMPMREVVVFRYLFDRSTAQTANMLDIPEGTVKSRLNRALNQLREEVTNGS